MNIGLVLDDLAYKLEQYAYVADALAYHAEGAALDHIKLVADLLYISMYEIVEQMKVLAKLAQHTDIGPYKNLFALPYKSNGGQHWHLATNEQVEQIRALLDCEGGQEAGGDNTDKEADGDGNDIKNG